MGLNLFYTDDCPATYEPHGFTNSIEDDLCFPGGQGLTRKSKKTSGLVVGAHRIGVVISHVDSAEDQDLLRVIPETMDYAIKRSRLDEYKATSKEPSIHDASLSSESLPMQPPDPGSIMASPAAPSTQTRDDIQTKEALQRMQRSSSRPKDLMPTQSLISADDIDVEDTNVPDQSYFHALVNTTLASERRERMIVPIKMAELIIHAKAIQERSALVDQIFDQDALNSYEVKRKEQPNVIKCECTDNSDIGIMVCDTQGRVSKDFADNNSFSVRFAARGSTNLAMAGTMWKTSTAQSTMSATAVSFCQKRRTSTTGCPSLSLAETRSSTSTREAFHPRAKKPI